MNEATTARVLIGARVRTLRRARGWTQGDLAARAGLNRSYLGGVERGDRNVSVDNLLRLAAALDISLAELVDTTPR